MAKRSCSLLAVLFLLVALPGARGQAFTVVSDIPYASEHPSQAFDWYPTPVASGSVPCVVFVHGGGKDGSSSKTQVLQGAHAGILARLLDNGISVMSIGFRPFPAYIYPVQVEDVATAIQFIRANAATYDIDPDRLMGWGHSGGANIVGLLAYGPDRADPLGDPVEQQSSRPLGFLNSKGPSDWTLMIGSYPALQFGQPTLATVAPALLDDASFAWHVTNTPRAFTPPAVSRFGTNENPPPLIDPHDVTMMKTFHTALAAFPVEAAQSVQLQEPVAPPELPIEWSMALWAMERFGLDHQLNIGDALAGQGGVTPLLWATGDFSTGGAFTLDFRASVSRAVTLHLLVGTSYLGQPFKGGTLVTDPFLIVSLPSDASGQLVLPGILPPGLPPGSRTYLQFWNADAAAPSDLAGSNGVLLLIE
ncbi:MAG: alpha/beta hydrolase fold domain-containing protein [Planctomycetota bacterium]